jgi:hypothetical protein
MVHKPSIKYADGAPGVSHEVFDKYREENSIETRENDSTFDRKDDVNFQDNVI